MASMTAHGNATSLDARRLDAYLRLRIDGLTGTIAIERIGGGQSNPTYFVTYDNARLVLRRRPDGELLPSAHAVDREFRVQAAVARAGIPVPGMLFYEPDETVLGTAFYVMDRVEGRIYHDNSLADLPRGERRTVYHDMAQTLARIHGIGVDAVGLSDFGKHGGFFARQIARWTKQWQMSRTRELDTIDFLIEWLPANCPADDRTTLVHGDFRTGNLILDPLQPKIAAVLDWELSTLGHPLADLAHTCVYIWMMNSDEFGVGLRDVDLAAAGLPDMGEFIEDYSRAASSQDRLTRFHLAFALFRNAVIFEGIADRARRGNASSANAGEVGALAPRFAERAAELVSHDGLAVV